MNYLGKTEVNVSEVTFKLSAASFKAELKASPTFRQRVFYRNDSSWYESHPLVRDEVERILALNPEPSSGAKE